MPPDSNLLLERFVADAHEAVGEGLRAILLYGEAATRRSDTALLTTAIVVGKVTTMLLKRVAPLAKSWRRRGLPTPLLLDTEQLCTSCDVFPLEMLALKDAHVMLWGDVDPLAELVVDREHLRLEVEEQLKGKLLHLRQAYLELSDSPKDLRSLLLDSSVGFEMILRGLVHLTGRERPRDSSSLIDHVEQQAAVELSTFRQVRAASLDGSAALGDIESTFEHYHDELGALASTVDRFACA